MKSGIMNNVLEFNSTFPSKPNSNVLFFEFMESIIICRNQKIPIIDFLIKHDVKLFGRKYTKFEIIIKFNGDHFSLSHNVEKNLDHIKDHITTCLSIIRIAETINNLNFIVNFHKEEEQMYNLLPPVIKTEVVHTIPERNISNQKQKTYIALDHNTGFYKIGKSKNPALREKTLQSEKPTIEIIEILKKDIEKKLHTKFASKRIRGEWFKLTKEEVDSIKD